MDTARHEPYIDWAMKTRESIRGFEVLSHRALPEYRADGLHLRHGTTGCGVLHLATADTENLFAFCFSTPPHDDTGVSHIVEHSVLSGSRKYPLKEPFSALMKGSMHTFLNALTYPDRTVYPAASCNHADFYNLLAVYGDAVFHPLLRQETFMQEAWRIEIGEGVVDEIPRYAGVVYNEMKGAHASPDSLAAEWTARSLMPDTPYRHDSGGDPAHIPELTLEAARAFQAGYYHPSNCRIFLYGDIPLEELLAFIGENLLAGFTAQSIDASIPLQNHWAGPRRATKTYPVKPDTPLEKRAIITLAWLLPAVTDPVELVTQEVLSEVLVESAGSPLRKALIDSGLGEDLSPVSGLETDLQQMIFAVGLRGTEPDHEEVISRLVLDALEALSRNGLDKGLVRSMINRVEFRHREIKGSGSPYALRLMGRALRGWVHGADPFDSLEFSRSMSELSARMAADPRYLEERLIRDFISNPHRLTLLVLADRTQEQREATEEKERVATLWARMSPVQKESALRNARSFKEYQSAPDSTESLALIPTLLREDIPATVERIPHLDSKTPSGFPLALHDIFTNEIIYLDLIFPTDSLPAEHSLLLPLFSRAVCGTGLPGIPYHVVALDLFRLTGGFSAALDAGGVAGRTQGFGQYIIFRTRFLKENLHAASALIGRLIREADFGDLDRLRDIFLELRNDMKAALIPSAHHFAMLRAAGMISEAVAREEEWRGVTQLLFLERLAESIDVELPRIAAALGQIRASLLAKPLLISNATAPADCFAEIARAVDGLASGLPAHAVPAVFSAGPRAGERPSGLKAESLVASATVGYVARAVPGIRFDHPLSGPVAVLGHLLSTGYLWEKVRMEGGAYGAFSYPRNMDGLFLLGSYRDPHIARTLRAFDDGLALMEKGDLEGGEVDKAVIGTVGREDRPLDPGEKGFVSIQRKLHGITDDARQARRTLLLAVDRHGISRAAKLLRESAGRGFTAVIANKRSLEEAAAEIPELAGRTIELPE
jgi:Zn-dependent M16 (insulinase) family peptidase